MVGMLAAVVVLGLLIGLVLWAWTEVRPALPGAGAPTRRLSARERALVEQSIAAARWATAHDELDGRTRVLLRRTCTGLDGRPEILDERVFQTFPADDPLWEARFTEAMSAARFRCRYLNAEEDQGQ
jgi:hypothetical protein